MKTFKEKIETLRELYSVMKPEHISKLHTIAFDKSNSYYEFGSAIKNGEDFMTLLKLYTKLYHIFEKREFST